MMPAQFGNIKIGGMQYGGVTIGEAMMDGQIVYQSGPPVVAITAKQASQAQSQFRAACTAHGVNYATVQELPFLLDTSTATHLGAAWQFEGMFYGCVALTTVPPMDTSNVTSMTHMFNGCSSLVYVPDMNTSQVTITASMFFNCASLTDGNVRLIGKHPSVTTTNMITGSGLTREPFLGAEGTIAARTLSNNTLTTLATHTITAAEGSNLKLLKMTLAWGNATATKSIRIDRNGVQVATATGQNPAATVEVVCNVGDVITYKATVNSTTTANRVINSGTWGAWTR